MRENSTVNYEWWKEMGISTKDFQFFRKGKIGDWLNHFSRDESIKFDQLIKENLKSEHHFNFGLSQEDIEKIHKAPPVVNK
jgi:hypothetical protein